MSAITVVLAYAFAAFVLAITFTAIFGPWLSFTLKIFELTFKKPFYGLISRQATRMNLWFGGLFSILVLATIAQGYLKLRSAILDSDKLNDTMAASMIAPPDLNMILLLAGAFVLYVALLAIAHFTWLNLRNRSAAQITLLLMAAVLGVAATALAYYIVAGRPQLLNPHYYLAIFTWLPSMYPFGIPTALSSGLMICKFISGGLGIASCMCACCMIIFRKRDDFGRDYYNFAVRHISRWGLATTLITMISGLAMMMILHKLIPIKINLLKISDIALPTLIYATCATFWFAIMRSLTPLRHKAGIWMSMAALLVAMIGHIIYVRTFFISIGMSPAMVSLG